MQTEFTSSYCNLDEISLFSASDALPADPVPAFASNPSTDHSFHSLFNQPLSIQAPSPGLSELFIDPYDEDKPSQTMSETNQDESPDRLEPEKSQTETKVDSRQAGEEAPETQVRQALHKGNVLNYAYLTSDKVYDPKHLPIEDKGQTFYYQDDPALYRKIKK